MKVTKMIAEVIRRNIETKMNEALSQHPDTIAFDNFCSEVNKELDEIVKKANEEAQEVFKKYSYLCDKWFVVKHYNPEYDSGCPLYKKAEETRKEYYMKAKKQIDDILLKLEFSGKDKAAIDELLNNVKF